jgi:oxalate decarboxylase/phosphoglucose isomerase-like protein (cupin superfamily)
MKRCILLLFLTAALVAQTTPELEITAEPHHHLVFENAEIRAFYVDLAPHADTVLHWHRHDYIFVMLGATQIVNAVEGKDPVTAKLQDAQAGFTPGGFAHVVHNQDQPFRNLTIEILEDDKLRQSPAHWDPAHPEEDRGLEVLQGGTKEILFVKDGIRVSEFELQPGGMIPMHKHTGPHLMVAVTDLDLQEHHLTDVHPPDLSHFMSGQVKWIPGGYSHTLTNSGKTPAKFVTLEFPSGTPK